MSTVLLTAALSVALAIALYRWWAWKAWSRYWEEKYWMRVETGEAFHRQVREDVSEKKP